jgi:hypothetical protein
MRLLVTKKAGRYLHIVTGNRTSSDYQSDTQRRNSKEIAFTWNQSKPRLRSLRCNFEVCIGFVSFWKLC